jgi:hypothetical protein
MFKQYLLLKLLFLERFIQFMGQIFDVGINKEVQNKALKVLN